MTQEQIKQAAEEYATKYYRRSAADIWSVAKLGYQAGANWAYQHGCIDPDTAELAGYKRGLAEARRLQSMTDDQIMAVLNAIGYEERSWIETVRRFIDRGIRDNNEQE